MDAVRLHLDGESQRLPGQSLAFVAALLGQMGAADAFAVKAAIVGNAIEKQERVPLLVEAAGGVGDQAAGDDEDEDDAEADEVAGEIDKPGCETRRAWVASYEATHALRVSHPGLSSPSG